MEKDWIEHIGGSNREVESKLKLLQSASREGMHRKLEWRLAEMIATHFEE